MKTILAFMAIFAATPAMAFELYHCTVNDVTDGYFNSIDIKVDGTTITGSTIIAGKPMDLGTNDVWAYFTPSMGDTRTLVVMYQPPLDMEEIEAFNLKNATGRLTPAARFRQNGRNQINRNVDVICEMATPL